MTRIGIVSSLMGDASVGPFSNLVRVLQSIASSTAVIEVYCLGCQRGIPESIRNEDSSTFRTLFHATGRSKVETVLRHILTQLKIGYYVVALARRVDYWVFHTPGDLTIPLMAAKLSGKRVVISIGGDEDSIVRWSTTDSSGLILERITIPFVKMNRLLADVIVLYSPILVEQWNMRRYAHKIRIAHKHFLDFQKFSVETGIGSRSTIIGYVGRLSPEKATMHFVEAIPLMLKAVEDARFVIAGDGSLRSSVEAYVRTNRLEDRVNVVGWVPSDELPGVLNKLRLLVVPSHTEGLPNVMLEAMACGAPVLAMPVGAIPDVVSDGETGFLMSDNSPEAIAENTARVLESGILGKVAENALELVRMTYTYENSVNAWKNVLRDL